MSIITKQELEIRKKKVREAHIMASLDNDAKYSEKYLKAEDDYVNGRISFEKFKQIVFNL